jgi:hypothetical protein
MKDKKGWSTIAQTGLLDCQMKYLDLLANI